MIETIKQYLGIEVNHLVEVDFKGFPKFVDALGGVNMTLREVHPLAIRRPHAPVPQGREPPQRRGGARRRAHPQERMRARGVRPHPRPPPAAVPRSGEGQAVQPVARSRAGHGSPGARRRRSSPTWAACSSWRSTGTWRWSGDLKPRILRPIDPGANPLQVSDAEKQAEVQRASSTADSANHVDSRARGARSPRSFAHRAVGATTPPRPRPPRRGTTGSGSPCRRGTSTARIRVPSTSTPLPRPRAV